VRAQPVQRPLAESISQTLIQGVSMVCIRFRVTPALTAA
jgi:hypothetical protein